MARQHKWRLDKKLTAMMIEDMQHNPVLASKVILRLKIPPQQELRILLMWTRHYMQDDSGFSTGKSVTLAIVSALRSVLFPERISGLISGTFRQAKLIFQNYDKWVSNSPIFSHCIKIQAGKQRMVHGNEAWEAYFRGGSMIRALPPNWTGDSTRLRSERWNDGYFDEWPIFDIPSLTKTLFGRVTAFNEHQDCHIRQNHIICAGTPGFTHDPAYSVVKNVDNNIAMGNKDYVRFTCNYRHIPKRDVWRGFIDRKTIFTMQTMNAPGVVRSEVDGIWQKDSMSYYSSKSITDARSRITLIVKRKIDSDLYFAGYDSARGGSNASTGKGDDFSLSVLRVTDFSEPPQHVKTVRKNNVTAEQMACIVQEEHMNFQFSFVCYDPGGGGLFVRDELKKVELPIRNKILRVMPLIEMGDPSGVVGDPILIPFKRGFFYNDQMWGKMTSDSVLVNRLHKSFSERIDEGGIILAGQWDGWENEGSSWDAGAKRQWLNMHSTGMKDTDLMRAEMDLAVEQLILVDVARNGDGSPRIDSHGMMRFLSKQKKDSAYGLIYAWHAYLIGKYAFEHGLSGAGTGESEMGLSIGML